jgi:hypothetical protein
MKSIMDLDKYQRDALMFWIKDMSGKEPITIYDPYGDKGELMNAFTHETRRESFEAAKQEAAARRRVILEILTEHGGMTAREVAGELHRRGITPTDERNYAAPRLTELCDAGKIRAVGKKLCAHSGRNVVVWAVRR